jgi:hypothetical protein
MAEVSSRRKKSRKNGAQDRRHKESTARRVVPFQIALTKTEAAKLAILGKLPIERFRGEDGRYNKANVLRALAHEAFQQYKSEIAAAKRAEDRFLAQVEGLVGDEEGEPTPA